MIMKPIRKAPGYEVAKAHLDTHFTQTAKVLATRDLKSACGGEGSLETYSYYIKRWQSEKLQGSGIVPTLLGLRQQLQANTAIVDAMIEQALRLATSLGAVADKIEDVSADAGADDIEDTSQAPSTDLEQPVESPNEAGLSNQPRACDQQISSTAAPPSSTDEIRNASTAAAPAAADQTRSAAQSDGGQVPPPSSTVPHPAPTDEGPKASTTAAPPAADRTRSEDEIDALARAAAEQAVPRFMGAADEDDSPNPAETGGEPEASRSAPVPTVRSSTENTNTSLSRSNGGAQQGALPLEPTQPAKGESDTTGGLANGTA
jgi:hypothetical protein